MLPVSNALTMPSPPTERQVYRFSVFEVDTYVGEVRKRGVRNKVQEQPFRLLTALLERPAELVTREDLHQKLWQGEAFRSFAQGHTLLFLAGCALSSRISEKCSHVEEPLP
jgi:DNA-binding response OmpR family regulator